MHEQSRLRAVYGTLVVSTHHIGCVVAVPLHYYVQHRAAINVRM
jgi:hypothetical protein